ncbi:MAG: carboxymuconolactone decarboxylase family protein [Salinirussus sp.]
MASDLPEEQRRVKERVLEQRGFWSSLFDELLFFQPQFVERYATLSAHPGDALERRLKELLHIAVDCNTTHLYHRGTRVHIQNALEHGATPDEIVEVIVLTSTIGLHDVASGAAILEDVTGSDRPDTSELQADLEDRLGFWTDSLDALLARDPTHIEHYANLLGVAWEEGPLSAAEKHLVLLATEIAPTRRNHEAARVHIDAALEAGLSEAEVMAAIETACVIGVHSVDTAPILAEEAARRGQLPDKLAAHPENVTFRDPRY